MGHGRHAHPAVRLAAAPSVTVKGENVTLVQHADYGLLQEQYKLWLDPGGLASAERQDHHWRLLADWQVTARNGM